MNEIRHTGIYVKDMSKMKNFYQEFFDMKEVVHKIEQSEYIQTILNLPCDSVEVCKLEDKAGGMIELLKVEIEQSITPNSPVWSWGKFHIAVTVEDIEYEFARMSKKGIKFISRPMVSPDNYAKVCFCMDVEGNYLELVEVL